MCVKGTDREDLNFASVLVQFLLKKSNGSKKKESLLFRSVPLFSSKCLSGTLLQGTPRVPDSQVWQVQGVTLSPFSFSMTNSVREKKEVISSFCEISLKGIL